MAIAFYPCCGVDIKEPLILLRDFVDEVIFCDIDNRLSKGWRRFVAHAEFGSPSSTFPVGDINEIVHQLPVINLLFYRRDSAGDGVSGVFVLGDSVLPPILQHFPAVGGLIITDGSNSRGSNFKRMIRPAGLIKHGWKFSMASQQPFMKACALHVINVTGLSPPPSEL
jgi:hypothetical protein